MSDNINPSHYKQGKIEVIEIIKEVTGEGFEGYCKGNIVKYLARYKYKNGVEDLRKGLWYLERLIKEVEEAK